MAELSDETLMAYADGELDLAGCVRVEAMLAADPASRARLEVFETTGRSLAIHYRKAIDAPAPQHLVELIMRDGRPQARLLQVERHNKRTERSAHTGFGAKLANALAASLPRWPMTLAYSSALLIAAGAGWVLHDAVTPISAPIGQFVVLEQGRLLAGGVLRRALEAAPSGVDTVASGGLEQQATVATRLTYRSRQQEFCRQYELTLSSGKNFAGIGCRASDGNWQVQAHIPITAQKGDRRTVPAGRDDPLGAMIQRTIEGDAFGAAEEAEAIGKQWRR